MAKKRANGEGNIRKRKEPLGGPVHHQIRLQDRKRIIGRTQAEVKEKLKRALEETKRSGCQQSGG